jgi:hypothetical protein
MVIPPPQVKAMTVTRTARAAQPVAPRGNVAPQARKAEQQAKTTAFAPKSPAEIRFERMNRNRATLMTALKAKPGAEATKLGNELAQAFRSGKTSGPEFKKLTDRLEKLTPTDYFAAANATTGTTDQFKTFLDDGPLAKLSLAKGDQLAKQLGIPSFEAGFSRDSTVRDAMNLWGE